MALIRMDTGNPLLNKTYSSTQTGNAWERSNIYYPDHIENPCYVRVTFASPFMLPTAPLIAQYYLRMCI